MRGLISVLSTATWFPSVRTIDVEFCLVAVVVGAQFDKPVLPIAAEPPPCRVPASWWRKGHLGELVLAAVHCEEDS